MSGYIENQIVILENIEDVFQTTNDLRQWPNLFTEYEKVDILKEEPGKFLFRLTTKPDENGKSKSWVSERIIHRDKKIATAERLEPKFPFLYMNITWFYESLPNNVGTIMTWVQEFDVDPKCPWSNSEMESYMNKKSRHEMKAIKEKIEIGSKTRC